MTDYPQGDGRADCPVCHGRGVIPLPKELRPPGAIGELTQICRCVLVRDIRANLERGWKGLSKASPVSTSKLMTKTGVDLWVTASHQRTRDHIRHVASRMGPSWSFLVISDAILMDAWLSKDISVFDADVDEIRIREKGTSAESLSELVLPPALLVVVLGVKAARNSAMPEVLQETLSLRSYAGRPTWVFDQPDYLLKEGHISYSSAVKSFICKWEHINLGVKSVSEKPPVVEHPVVQEHSVVQEPPATDDILEDNKEAVSYGNSQLDASVKDERMKVANKKNWKKKYK